MAPVYIYSKSPINPTALEASPLQGVAPVTIYSSSPIRPTTENSNRDSTSNVKDGSGTTIADSNRRNSSISSSSSVFALTSSFSNTVPTQAVNSRPGKQVAKHSPTKQLHASNVPTGPGADRPRTIQDGSYYDQPEHKSQASTSILASYLPDVTADNNSDDSDSVLSHPHGYQQNVHAFEYTASQRAAHEAASRNHTLAFNMGMPGQEGDVPPGWNVTRQFVAAASQKLASAEEDMWNRINMSLGG
ncbi:hypothetical protein BROUX41_001908 [Berkeleyomyces rouxiae]|uniref:uncharacterized protein n=1 Tax=Berkeleyomyces rouxiae TaxID=2035830 RepID=UPI003B8156A8